MSPCKIGHIPWHYKYNTLNLARKFPVPVLHRVEPSTIVWTDWHPDTYDLLSNLSAHPDGSREGSLNNALCGIDQKKTICCFNKFWSEGIFVAFLGEDLFRLLPEGSIELVCQFIPLTMGKEFQRQYVFDYNQTIFNITTPCECRDGHYFSHLFYVYT